MNLKITLTALAIVLRFTVPEHCSFWLVSTEDNLQYRVELSAHATEDSHVVWTMPRTNACRFFQVWIEPEKDE